MLSLVLPHLALVELLLLVVDCLVAVHGAGKAGEAGRSGRVGGDVEWTVAEGRGSVIGEGIIFVWSGEFSGMVFMAAWRRPGHGAGVELHIMGGSGPGHPPSLGNSPQRSSSLGAQ